MVKINAKDEGQEFAEAAEDAPEVISSFGRR
jgi:hypothetical protein